MADILKINAVEYGGAVAHVAAFRAFEILTEGNAELHGSSFDWYGGSQDPEAEETEVMALAEYTANTGAIGEQLWRYGIIAGLIVQDELKQPQFDELTFAHQVAFNTFTSTCLGAELEMRKAQLAAEKAEREANRPDPAPLALEDSIFEPEASLNDQHEYQKQYLKDQADAAKRQAASVIPAAEPVGFTLPVASGSLSLGKIDQDEINAKTDSENGSEVGGTPSADTNAQGEAPELDATADGEGSEELSPAAPGASENSAELAPAVANEASEAAGENDAAGGAETSATKAELTADDSQTAEKSSKGKKQN